MLAGALRQIVRIETPIETPDGAGGSTTAWTLVCEPRAAVTPLSGRERALQSANDADVSHTVTLRFRAGITPKCRLVYGSRVFRIVAGLDVEERHRELTLSCLEVLAEATS